MTDNKDRYKYFRIEARELLDGLNRGALELDRGNRGKDVVANILRLAHTLKGAARVVKQGEIAELAHSIEDQLAPHRDRPDAISKEHINQILAFLDAAVAQLATLDLVKADAPKTIRQPVAEEFSETVRVEIEEADRLLDGISETALQLTALQHSAEATERARRLAGTLLESLSLRPKTEANGAWLAMVSLKTQALAEELCICLDQVDRSLMTGIDRVKSELTQVHDTANRLRLLPVSRVFASLERAVRDAAQALEKSVLFQSFGGEFRLDTHVLGEIQAALLHMVRNAVAHGIEAPPERVAAGKPVQGCVELRVERRGNRMAFICRDDGRGIDVAAVREAAVRLSVVEPAVAASLGLEEVVQLLMKGGISTSRSVDEVSGRGIGLDVVRETASRLKGEVRVRSERGQGTSVEIEVPVSLSSLAALEFEAGGVIASVPLDAVCEVIRVVDHEIARSSGKESIVHNGKAIPFMALARSLAAKPNAERRRRAWPAIVVKASSGTAAIGVDQLLGAVYVVVRPLPAFVKATSIIAGASLDGEGNPQLVLDPEGIVEAACLGATPVAEESQARRPPILVIDDSLTTRMLEQSILESAGYEVDLATSGEAGLVKAKEKHYGLFLVDVEMPGIDGFEFVSRTQAEIDLREVPSILVTSRSTAEDQRRGQVAGARAYIVKGEFDQTRLLETIRELIG